MLMTECTYEVSRPALVCVIMFPSSWLLPHRNQSAVELLNSTQSNASILQALRASGGKLNERSMPEMNEYMNRLGYSVCRVFGHSWLAGSLMAEATQAPSSP